jgi:glycosyltransferase involved in cell wall biosynthesis
LKKKFPLISIILPVRNEEKYISSALRSIKNQDYPDKYIEIIIADGNSNDNTIKEIKKNQNKFYNLQIIQNKDRIVSTGFNLALNQSKGDYILRVDGHCEIPKNYISRCIEIIQKSDVEIVGGCINTISSGKIGKAIALAQSSKFGVGGVKFRNRNNSYYGAVDTVPFGLHKREIFYELGGYDEEMICNQDDEFNFRATQLNKVIIMDSKLVTIYHARNSFKNIFTQYYNYGKYKVRGIQKRGSIFSIRHIIPSLFLCGIVTTILYAYFLNQFLPFYLLFGIYIIVNTYHSIIYSELKHLFPLVFFSNMLLHIGYGSGFLVGLIVFINKWSDRSLKDFHFNKEEYSRFIT